MKRIVLFLSFSFACVLGTACAEDPEVTCEVIWSANDVEVGRTTLVYEGTDDVDAGLSRCLDDQADHEERPASATMHNCNCSN